MENKNTNGNFVDLFNQNYFYRTELRDEHEIIKIVNKSPVLENVNIGNIVRGETNSNILTFEIDRYYDGADLSTMGIQFLVKSGDAISVEPAYNLQYSDEQIRFSWVMSYFATSCKSVTATIEFYGVIDNDIDYSLKTTPFTIRVKDSLDLNAINDGFISDHPTNYLISLSNRVIRLEEKLSGESDSSLATKKDISDAIEAMAFEDAPITFLNFAEVKNEETN